MQAWRLANASVIHVAVAVAWCICGCVQRWCNVHCTKFCMPLAATFLQHFASWDKELKHHWDKTKLFHITISHQPHLVPWTSATIVAAARTTCDVLVTKHPQGGHLISAPTPTPQHRPVGQTDKDLARPAPAELAEPGPEGSSARLTGRQVAMAIEPKAGTDGVLATIKSCAAGPRRAHSPGQAKPSTVFAQEHG